MLDYACYSCCMSSSTVLLSIYIYIVFCFSVFCTVLAPFNFTLVENGLCYGILVAVCDVVFRANFPKSQAYVYSIARVQYLPHTHSEF